MYNVVGGDGQVYGPVGTDTLVEWCKEGRIIARTNLMDPISGRVLRAEDLPELRDILMPAPPPVAPEPPVYNPQQAPPGPPLQQMTQQQMPQQQMPQVQMPQPMMPQPMMPQQMPPQHGSAHFVATQVNAYPPQPTAGYGPMAQGQMPMPGQVPGPYGQQPMGQQTPVIQVNNVVASYQQSAYPPTPYLQQVPSQKSKATALLLCFFFGGFGVHRFYLGHNVSGAIMLGTGLFSMGAISVPWAIIDFILICVGSINDKDGRPLS